MMTQYTPALGSPGPRTGLMPKDRPSECGRQGQGAGPNSPALDVKRDAPLGLAQVGPQPPALSGRCVSVGRRRGARGHSHLQGHCDLGALPEREGPLGGTAQVGERRAHRDRSAATYA